MNRRPLLAAATSTMSSRPSAWSTLRPREREVEVTMKTSAQFVPISRRSMLIGSATVVAGFGPGIAAGRSAHAAEPDPARPGEGDRLATFT